MANVLDYLKWRGDLSLDENPFNEVDAMVLARISYIPFDGIVAANFKERILLKEAAEVFFQIGKTVRRKFCGIPIWNSCHC